MSVTDASLESELREEDEEDEVGSQGNRGNSIYTFARVNPKDFSPNCLFVDSDLSEVEVINPKLKKKAKKESWILDDRSEYLILKAFMHTFFMSPHFTRATCSVLLCCLMSQC